MLKEAAHDVDIRNAQQYEPLSNIIEKKNESRSISRAFLSLNMEMSEPSNRNKLLAINAITSSN